VTTKSNVLYECLLLVCCTGLQAGTWSQEARVVAPDGVAYDNFGWSISVSGDTAIIGMGPAQFPNPSQGKAYIFVRSGATWMLQQELTPPPDPDPLSNVDFGGSVSIDGDTALIGSWYKKNGSNIGQGAAYVFVRMGSTWFQQAVLTAPDGHAFDSFGFSVSVNGNTALVGAPGNLLAGSRTNGKAYVFVRSGTSWTLQQELIASDGAQGDSFGQSVSLSEGKSAIGAPFRKVGSNAQAGAAYVFARSRITICCPLPWYQEQELIPTNSAAYDHFGYSIAIAGDTSVFRNPGAVVVGAPGRKIGSNYQQGAAYIFAPGRTWIQYSMLYDGAGTQYAGFGKSVSISESIVAVGAPGQGFGVPGPSPVIHPEGAAYIFGFTDGVWFLEQELKGTVLGGGFGMSVSVHGDAAAVGATGEDKSHGAAYLFRSH
jgi:hypothetical protein